MVNATMGSGRVGRVVAVTEEDEERLNRPLRNLFQTELMLHPIAESGLIRAVCRHRPTTGKIY